MIINADLHIHSKYSGGTSERMDLETIAGESRRKGIELVGTGDCLHPLWLQSIKRHRTERPVFVPTTEVEDKDRVHHLLIFPSCSKAEEYREAVRAHAPNIDTDGRPHIEWGGEAIAQAAKDCEALIGPAHAFTPWTALYAYHDSLSSCYGDLTDYVTFLELGLSADTDYADRIAALRSLAFLSNSDAHSPHPVRLAREFNRFDLRDTDFDSLKEAITKGGVTLNVGLPPAEGKYNESTCIRCLQHYPLAECERLRWRCPCGGRIKKGVKDRVEELADYAKPHHPPNRPPYLHMIPLAEIIALALGRSSPYTKSVIAQWHELIQSFGSETTILIDAPLEEIERRTVEAVGSAIGAFRRGDIIVHPGGGGVYGKLELPGGGRQSTLGDF